MTKRQTKNDDLSIISKIVVIFIVIFLFLIYFFSLSSIKVEKNVIILGIERVEKDVIILYTNKGKYKIINFGGYKTKSEGLYFQSKRLIGYTCDLEIMHSYGVLDIKNCKIENNK